jgi:hypothetical protein
MGRDPPFPLSLWDKAGVGEDKGLCYPGMFLLIGSVGEGPSSFRTRKDRDDVGAPELKITCSSKSM